MFNFICKYFPVHLRYSLRTSPTRELHYLQLHLLTPFSTRVSLKPKSKDAKDGSFTVNYLIKTCGFAPEKAISASKYVKFNKPDKPDAVIAFLKNQGFSETQVLNLIKNCPPVLLCDPKGTLLPKIEFFQLKGFSKTCLTSILTKAPVIFKSNLERQIIPSFDYINNLLGSVELTFVSIKRYPWILVYGRSYMVPNIEILQKAGVPESNIVFLVKNNSRVLLKTLDRFKEAVEEVKGMGISPQRLMFVIGLWVRNSLTKMNWMKKMEIYKRWGCSEEDVKEAFRKHPWCMTISEDKITRIMNVLVNEMGWDPSSVMRRPRLISSSLKKIIIPRCSVYQVLLSKGLVQEKCSMNALLEPPEVVFLKRFVECHDEEAPMLLNLYREKLENSE